jgi:HK97 family phage portal protein
MSTVAPIGRTYPAEKRSSERGWWSIFSDYYGIQETAANVQVTPQSSLTLSAVSAAVRLVMETIGSLPLITYQRFGDDRKRATDNPIYQLLHDSPNPWMTSMVFGETSVLHELLWNVSYTEIVRDRSGVPRQLIPIEPWRCKPKMKGTDFYFEVDLSVSDIGTFQNAKRIDNEDMIYIPAFTLNGFSPSPFIAYAIESLALSLAAEQFGASFFGNSAKPSGVLEHPGHLDNNAAQRLRESWQATQGGSRNTGKVAVLEEGMTFKPMSTQPNDAQFIETRKFQVEEVCRWFRVPPHKIGYLEKATFSNIEQQSIDFVTDSIRPRLVRREQEINRKLLGGDYYCEYLVDGLLRGDSAARHEGYIKGRQWGYYSINDVHRMENLPLLPSEIGDVYLVPMNMVPADRVNDVIDNMSDKQQAPAMKAPDTKGQIRSAHREALADAAKRMILIETNAARRKIVSNRSTLADWMNEFYPKHSKKMKDALYPAVNAYLATAGESRSARDVLDVAINDYVNESKASLVSSADCDPGAWPSIIDQVFSRWEVDRVNDLADSIMGVSDA